MIGEQKNREDGYVMVGCKVPPHVAELMNILADMRGMRVYELIQLLINGFISYAKAETSVPDEFRHLYESLKMDSAWNHAYNFASPTAQQDIAQLVLILQQPGRKGFGMAKIDKPFMSDARMTISEPDIVERVLELAMGFRDYTYLRQMVTYHNATSSLDMIRKMLAAQVILDIEDSNRNELPGMGNYHDFGRAIEYGQRTRQKKHRTPDSLANSQQKIIFDDYDREVADYEAKGWEGSQRNTENDEPPVRPFDQEW